MLLYSEEQVRQAINIDDMIRAIREAFARGFATVHMPVRTVLNMDNAILLVMPCYDSALHAAGVKLVSVSAKSGVQAAYELLDPETGTTLARMEANYLTDARTAATSAVATDLLAREDVETLGIFGTGRQAIAHFAALPRVRTFKRFLVCGSGRSDIMAFCNTIKNNLGLNVEPANAETVARESDVICTCTTATSPLFDGRCLRPGAHLNLVGAFQPDTREVDEITIKRSYVVVDTYGGALQEAGDLLIPIKNGSIDRSHIAADLHEIASGKKAARTSAESITLFKSVGCAAGRFGNSAVDISCGSPQSN